MTRLWEALVGKSDAMEKRDGFGSLTMSDWMQMFKYNGNNYPILGMTTGNDVEQVPNDFLGYVRGAYKTNSIAFACMLLRMTIFSEARFAYQRMEKGRPAGLFSNANLGIFDNPWPNGTTGGLLNRMIQDTDLCGNSYTVKEGAGDKARLRRLRPDWVTIILTAPPDHAVQSDIAGYLYQPGGPGSNADPKLYLVEEVAHWTPIPDPEAQYRGMSWLTPLITEIQSDKAATQHKARFFSNGAVPGLAVTLKDSTVSESEFKGFQKRMNEAHVGTESAYRTLYLGAGADVKVIGQNMEQVDFKDVTGQIENRISMAAGIPAMLLGVSESLKGSGLNSGEFIAARDWFASKTMRPLWSSASAALATLVPKIPGSRLSYDERDILALRADRDVLAGVQQKQAAIVSSYISAGFEPNSAVSAVMNDDMGLLKHSGLVSVQLQPPGSQVPDPGAAFPDAAPNPFADDSGAPAAPPGKAKPPVVPPKSPAKKTAPPKPGSAPA